MSANRVAAIEVMTDDELLELGRDFAEMVRNDPINIGDSLIRSLSEDVRAAPPEVVRGFFLVLERGRAGHATMPARFDQDVATAIRQALAHLDATEGEPPRVATTHLTSSFGAPPTSRERGCQDL